MPLRLLASWCRLSDATNVSQTSTCWCTSSTQCTEVSPCSWSGHCVLVCVQCTLTGNWYLYVQMWQAGGSLYTHPRPPFRQAIAIPGAAFCLASHILTLVLTRRLLDCSHWNIQCDNCQIVLVTTCMRGCQQELKLNANEWVTSRCKDGSN